MQSIYDCPHCGKRTFNPLTKAMTGALNSKGRACKACGRKCVNGKTSMVAHFVLSLLLGAFVVYSFIFVKNPQAAALRMLIALVSYQLVIRLLDAFLFPLAKAIRMDA